MTLKILGLLFASHLLGDVIFTSSRLAILKRSNKFWLRLNGLVRHSAVHAFFAGLFLFISASPWLKGAFLILGIHFIIDYIRTGTEIRMFGANTLIIKRLEFIAWLSGRNRNQEKINSQNLRTWLLINILDQGAHMMSLFCIALMINP